MKESSVRTKILDTASRLFYEQGYNSTGINQVIEEADIARASLYNHFATKTDLMIAYLQSAEEKWFVELDAFLKPIKDPRKKIIGMFDFRMARQLRTNFGGCQFIKISSEVSRDEKKVFEIVKHQKEHVKIYIKNILKELEEDQKHLLPTDMLAETLFLLMEGATVTAGIYKDQNGFKNAKKIAEKLL